MNRYTNELPYPFDEFIDGVICASGYCYPLPGSDADFAYDDEEYREYAKILGLKCVEVHHEP